MKFIVRKFARLFTVPLVRLLQSDSIPGRWGLSLIVAVFTVPIGAEMTEPELLKIEVTSRCNAKCVFCLHDGYKGEDMSWGVFKTVVDSFKTRMVHPQFFGEPTLYPYFVEAIKYLKSKHRTVVFYTNGSFPYGNVNEVLKAAPDRIIFSVEADNERLYQEIRPGLNWNDLLKNIEICRTSFTATSIRMTVCKENKDRIQKIVKFWQGKGFPVTAVPESPLKRGEPGRYNKYFCSRPLKQFVVKANGDIVLCCVDWLSKNVLGNVEDGCRDVWNNEKFENLRQTINTENAPAICKKCGFKMR